MIISKKFEDTKGVIRSH